MKYYDSYLPYFVNECCDLSYPAPEIQLLWRLDDLQDRLEELTAKAAPNNNNFIYSKNDIRYSLPKDLKDVSKVEQAIELAKEDLVKKYGLPDPDKINPAWLDLVNKDCFVQVTMLDFISEALSRSA